MRYLRTFRVLRKNRQYPAAALQSFRPDEGVVCTLPRKGHSSDKLPTMRQNVPRAKNFRLDQHASWPIDFDRLQASHESLRRALLL